MKSKKIAAALAFTMGIFGVHRFYLGQKFKGMLHFLFGVFGFIILFEEGEPLMLIPALIAAIDGVLFLAMPKEEFNEKYNRKFLRAQANGFYNAPPNRQAPSKNSYRKDYRTDQPRNQKSIPNPYKRSGIAKFNEYDYDGAIDDFKKALRAKYNDRSVHFNIACCYSINEEANLALFHLDKAVSFGFVDFDKIHHHNALAFVRTDESYDDFVKNGYRLLQAGSVSEDPNNNQSARPEFGNLLEQIQKLGELREKGILTEEEFTSQKQKLFE